MNVEKSYITTAIYYYRDVLNMDDCRDIGFPGRPRCKNFFFKNVHFILITLGKWDENGV